MHAARHVCPFVVVLSLSAPAFAQDPLPVDPPSVDGASAPATIEGGGQNVFKLVAGDFKHFFRADTAKVMSYFAIAAVATAPWDREGVNNGFNIPTTLFQSGNIAGTFAFQVGAGCTRPKTSALKCSAAS